MKLVIGLVGRIGSGKGVVSNYLSRKYGASPHKFSDVLKDILDRLYLTHERWYFQKLGECVRDSLGQDVIVNAFKRDLESAKGEILVLDGIRFWNEVEMLKGFKNSLLLHISAPKKIRYERCKLRAERGEENISFEEFLEAEERKTEIYIDDIGEKADFAVVNDGTIEELQEKVDRIIKGRME